MIITAISSYLYLVCKALNLALRWWCKVGQKSNLVYHGKGSKIGPLSRTTVDLLCTAYEHWPESSMHVSAYPCVHVPWEKKRLHGSQNVWAIIVCTSLWDPCLFPTGSVNIEEILDLSYWTERLSRYWKSVIEILWNPLSFMHVCVKLDLALKNTIRNWATI